MNRLVLRAAAAPFLLLLACQHSAPETAATRDLSLQARCALGNAPAGTRILVYSKTSGYRHASIPAAAAAIKSLGEAHGFAVEHTEDPTVFTDENLSRFAAVTFLMNTQKVLDSAQRAAFQRYIRKGGALVGIHASSNAEIDWPWYGELTSAFFLRHPAIQKATVRVEDANHPSTRCVPTTWVRTDEWYNFKTMPIAGSHVLVTVAESTYTGGSMGAYHPLAWYHTYDGGKAWYTAMGHYDEHWSDPAFRSHILGGILWAVAR
jgi:type 1 glutamine amidotransferase